MLDRRTTLCLACSSSLPPNVDDSELFMTKCCQRPICPRCLETNPRLARYNPCLACLAGVGVIQASSSTRNTSGGKHVGGTGAQSARVENLDGGVKDQDMFVLGDDDEDDEDEDTSTDGEDDRQVRRSAAPPPPDVVPKLSHLLETPPPPTVTKRTEDLPVANATSTPPIPDVSERPPAEPDSPVFYRLRRGDTLTGIALRFRLDAMELCRLNDLPTTTLSTTPHLIHTRTTILLSPTSKPPPDDQALDEARRVERAQKRLQTVTKEIDWSVAKAYVAIAQGSDSSEMPEKKSGNREGCLQKTPDSESGGTSQRVAYEAIDRYLDDTEWEEQERKEGRGLVIQKFPWGSFGQKVGPSSGSEQGSGRFKWPWSD